MITAAERRQQILLLLSHRRVITLSELIVECGVSRSTIKRDIEISSCSAPIFTIRGKGGGIYVSEGWYLSRIYLTDTQEALLHKLSENLTDDDMDVMQSILCSFAKPKPIV